MMPLQVVICKMRHLSICLHSRSSSQSVGDGVHTSTCGVLIFNSGKLKSREMPFQALYTQEPDSRGIRSTSEIFTSQRRETSFTSCDAEQDAHIGIIYTLQLPKGQWPRGDPGCSRDTPVGAAAHREPTPRQGHL